MSRSLSPDTFVAESAGPTPGMPPEQQLMVAIVRRAVYDFALYRDLDEHDPMYVYAIDAAGWLFWDGDEEVDEEGRMTFRYICEIIGVEPSHIRHRALNLNREDIRRLNTSSKGD